MPGSEHPLGRLPRLPWLVITTMGTTARWLCWLDRSGLASRVRTAVYLHGRSSWDLAHAAEPALVDRIDTWFVPSPGSVYPWHEFRGWPPRGRVVSCQPGFDPARYTPTDPQSATVRLRDSKRIGGLLAFNPVFSKGGLTLLQLARALPDVRFCVVAGRAQPYPGLEGCPNVAILPPREDVRPLMSAADLLLLPSRDETFGRVLVEAQAAGLPVVASDLPTLWATAGGAAGAAWCPVDDVQAWARTIRTLLADGAARATLAEAGRINAARYAPDSDFVGLLRVIVGPGAAVTSTRRSVRVPISASPDSPPALPAPPAPPSAADLPSEPVAPAEPPLSPSPPPPSPPPAIASVRAVAPAPAVAVPPSLPFAPGDRLHLGCGGKRLAGWANTDIRPDKAPDGVVDVYATPLPADTFGAIYACHLLEHLYPEETVPVLRRWLAALVPGGTLRLSVPDLRLVVANCVESHAFGRNPDAPLFGDFRREAHEWDRHKRSFTREILARLLGEAGFVRVRPWRAADYPEIAAARDWASYETISLNLEADRPASSPRTVRVAPAAGLDVSVIVGTYNRLPLLRDFVASIRESLAGSRYTWEVVVADGGSTDGTREWLAAQPDCRMVEGGLDGAIPAFNAAYAASRGEFVLHANDDTRVVGSSVAEAVEHLREHPETAQVVFEFSRDGGKTWHGEGPAAHPHPNQAVTRRVAIEDIVAYELGAFWGDEDHRTDPTYGGDSYQGILLERRGWRARRLPGQVRILDRMRETDDDLRRRNYERVQEGEHSRRFLAMTRTRGPGAVTSALPGPGEWPECYVPEPGRLPRRSPVEAGPPERLLLLHMGWRVEPLAGLRRSFARMGPTVEVGWVEAKERGGDDALRADVLAAARRHQPTLVWAQIQRPHQFPLDLLREVRAVLPQDCLIVTWNGDVRAGGHEPMEPWQAELGRMVDLYLVSNCSQPAMLAADGVPRAGYLPVGYDPALSCHRPDARPHDGEEGAVFLGQNYTRLDGGYRQRLFEAVEAALPGAVSLYGNGWPLADTLRARARPYIDQVGASHLYSRARMAVATSLFADLRRYTSDRLKRMMGCGACVAMRRFDDYEGLGIRDGVHAVVWDSPDDLIEVLRDWLRPERDGDRAAMRAAARELAERTMTWDAIVENLLAIVRAERLVRAGGGQHA